MLILIVCYILYFRWFDKSTGSTDEDKKADAISHIEYYFAHVINDVSLKKSFGLFSKDKCHYNVLFSRMNGLYLNEVSSL